MASSNSSTVKGGGNTKSPPAPSKKWTFTLNNYTDEEVDVFCSNCSKVGQYFFGKEVGESGTPHLQGFVEFFAKKRPLAVFKGLGLDRIHWEKMRGTIDQSIVYYSKGS